MDNLLKESILENEEGLGKRYQQLVIQEKARQAEGLLQVERLVLDPVGKMSEQKNEVDKVELVSPSTTQQMNESATFSQDHANEYEDDKRDQDEYRERDVGAQEQIEKVEEAEEPQGQNEKAEGTDDTQEQNGEKADKQEMVNVEESANEEQSHADKGPESECQEQAVATAPEEETVDEETGSPRFGRMRVDQPTEASLDTLEEEVTAERREHQEKIKVIQVSACKKLQSLWKGHVTRKQYTGLAPRFQVVKLENLTLMCSQSELLHYIKSLDTKFRFTLTVWNLSTSMRVFKWFSPFQDTSKLSCRSIDISGEERKNKKDISVLIPGIDDDCVLSLALEVNGRIVLDASLIDLDVFQGSFLTERKKYVKVRAINKSRLSKRSKRNAIHSESVEGEPEAFFGFNVRSAAHMYCGWLWASDGTEQTGTKRERNKEKRISAILPTVSIKNAKNASSVLGLLRQAFPSCFPEPEIPQQQQKKKKKKVQDKTPDPVNLAHGPKVATLEMGGKEHLAREEYSANSIAPPPPEMLVEGRLAPPISLKSQWDWYPLWGALFDGELLLYNHYGSLQPSLIIPVASLQVTPYLFEKSDISEFRLSHKDDRNMEPISKPNKNLCKSCPLSESSKISFIAEGRPHAISWVTKIKAHVVYK